MFVYILYCSHCYITANRSPANKFVGYGSPVLTWPAAQAFCRRQHTDLASSITAADITLLTQVLASIMWTGAFFGLTRDTWKWSDGTVPLNLPWAIGQPNNLNGWENCGAAQNGLLQDEKCTNQYYFVCSACEYFTFLIFDTHQISLPKYGSIVASPFTGSPV